MITKLAAASLAWMAATLPVPAAELIMIEQPGCPWCRFFDRDIAPAYPNTPEGRTAPLRRVDITERWPDDLAWLPRERMTPIFILVDDEQEIGRINGYPGDEFFWYHLGELLEKLDDKDRT